MSPHHYVTDDQGTWVSPCKHHPPPYQPAAIGLLEMSGMAGQAVADSSGNEEGMVSGVRGRGGKCRGLCAEKHVDARGEKGRGSHSGKNCRVMGGSDEEIVELSSE